MHTVAQIIEALQINNLPHLPNGDFIITEKQQQSILSLLSQQAVVDSDVVFSRIEVMNLLTDFGIQVYKNKDYDWDMPNDAGIFLTDYMRSPDYKEHTSQQAVVEQTDHPLSFRELTDLAADLASDYPISYEQAIRIIKDVRQQLSKEMQVESDEEGYNPIWLDIIERVEKDNNACEAYADTIKMLQEKYIVIPKK
jgi:hypothetical protein